MKLFALWSYDGTTLLGGEVDKINKDGLVYIKSYMAWFKPIHIVPLKVGPKILEEFKLAREERDDAIKAVRKEHNKKYHALLEKYRIRAK